MTYVNIAGFIWKIGDSLTLVNQTSLSLTVDYDYNRRIYLQIVLAMGLRRKAKVLPKPIHTRNFTMLRTLW